MVFEKLGILKAETVHQEFRVLRRALNAAISARTLEKLRHMLQQQLSRDYY
jgi:hypothetical protein